MTYIKTRNGNKLYIKDWGKGRPVILIHGWLLNADTWDEAAMAIADAGYRAISYDRLGFGRSSQPFDGYDYDSLADDLADVMKETSARDATIIGFSMGGGEVARYMSRHEGKDVVKAGLVSSVLPFLLKTENNPEGVDAAVFDGIAETIKADRATFFDGFFRDFFGPKASEQTREWARKMAMEASLRATLACAKSFSSTDFRGDIPAIRVPTMMIHGTGDKTVPIEVASRRAIASMPSAQLIEYEGEPHGLFATAKARLISDIVSFLKS